MFRKLWGCKLNTLDYIRRNLTENNLSLVIAKDNQILLSSQESGVKTLYKIATSWGELLNNASVADTVVGKAAAMIYVDCGVKEIYAQLISERAIPLLESNNIAFTYDTKVPNIMNKQQNDLCPMEKMGIAASSVKELYFNIGKFIEIKQLKKSV